MAVVGTRRPTHYGRETADRMAYGLAKAGYSVVSGLARGIDTAAHRGAIKARGRTLAVLGGGLDDVYPPENAELAREISENGAVLSEFPLGRRPDKTTFPMRNRIVSGLSAGVLVVEAGLKSGAMITVASALEQGRQAFAVPGRVDSPASQGTHRLIRDGAVLVTHVDDILAEQDTLLSRNELREAAVRPKPSLSQDESRLLGFLADGARDVDSLIRESGLKPAGVNAVLISLEMKRLVRMQPGRVVEPVTPVMV
jgi:DNA processing protein